MPHVIAGKLTAPDAKIAIVVSRFNDFFTSKLLDGAIDTHTRHGGNEANLTVVWVPGSFELPVTAKTLAASGKYAAVVCLGCVIRGATSHYDFVAGEAARGIAQVGLDTGVPTIFGVITAENIEQATERSGSKQGNTGANAMLAAIEMIHVMKQVAGG